MSVRLVDNDILQDFRTGSLRTLLFESLGLYSIVILYIRSIFLYIRSSLIFITPLEILARIRMAYRVTNRNQYNWESPKNSITLSRVMFVLNVTT